MNRRLSRGALVIDDDRLNELKLIAFSAAQDAAQWTVLLDRLRSVFGATSAHLRMAPLPSRTEARLWIESGIDREIKSKYASFWGAYDPWALHPRGHNISTAGRCFIGSEILPWKKLEKTEFYNDFGRYSGVKGVISGMVEDGLDARGAPQTKLALFRAPDLPEFDAEALRTFASLQAPLRQALNSFWAFRQLQDRSLAVDEAFEVVPSAVLVLRSDATIEYANSAGWQRHAEGVLTIASGKLRRVAQLSEEALSALIATTFREAPQQCGLWVNDVRQIRTGVLRLAKLDLESRIRLSWPRACVVAAIQLDDSRLTRMSRLEALREKHRLTTGEAHVLAQLADGLTPDAIARTQGVRVSTVRTHIRHLLEKTWTSRLVDLVRLVSG